MSNTLKVKREALEGLTAEFEKLATDLEAKSELTGEDREKLTRMGAQITERVADLKASTNANDQRAIAQELLLELASGQAASAAPVDGKAAPIVHSSGIVTPGRGMTVGEAFVKSPAYVDFCNAFRGSDGRIREVSNIKSASFSMPGLPGFNSKLITGASDTAGGAFVTPQRLPEVVDLIGRRELTVDALCTHIPITTDVFEYVTVTGKTNNAAPVLEATSSADGATYGVPAVGGGYKPESTFDLAVVSSPVETIAHLMAITRRAAGDAPQARAMIDAFMLDGLAEARENQILNGNGTSPNLRGIMNTPGISTVGSAGTDIDAVLAAIAQIRSDRRRPNAIVVHPDDWYSTGFLLAKDSQGHYLVGDPRATIDQLNSLWGLQVVVTEALPANTLLVGDFKMAVVADRMQAELFITDSHKDWFGRNILAVLAEERLGFGVLDPDAFCTVTAV